jgi:hypothetical protein
MADMSWRTVFKTVTIVDKFISPCNYVFEIAFDLDTEDTAKQNTAFLRIKHLIENVLNDSIFICLDNTLLPVLKKDSETAVITFILEPMDLVIATTLWRKIEAITDGLLVIERISLSSDKADNLTINLSQDFMEDASMLEEDPFKKYGKPAWWFRNDLGVEDWIEEGDPQMQIHYNVNRWPDYLEWDYEFKEEDAEPKDNVVPLDKKWKPEVITGDKT